MLFRSIRFFFLIFSLAFSSSLFAQDNYQQWVNDITSRLDKTAQLVQQGNTDDARTEVQMAYFEVFENLEGPIRINFSAQKSYQMEATFGEIRKMIGEGSSQQEIQAKIDQLKKELQEVLPSLIEGHQLNADGQHGVYDNQEIAPYWQQSFKTIDDLLAQGLEAYQNGDLANAKKLFQQAQYDGYKNSEMEMSIRQNRSAETSAAINQQFYNIIRLSEQADQITEIGYQSTQLLQDIEENLPNLPTTREEQNVQSNATQQATDNQQEQDWNKIKQEINQRIQQAIALYQQGESKKAILSVQDTYFDVFESSGMENKIGSRDSNFKAELEGYFTRLVSLMKAEQGDKLQAQADGLDQNLTKAVEMLHPIYEYRNEALRNIDTKMNAERDRGRLKRLNREFEEELKNYIESVNGNTEVIFQLANQYFRMNEYDRARKIFSMDKTDIRNVFGAATTARFLGRNEEAISLYNDALNIDSSFYEAYLGRGIANRNLQNYDSALSDFKQYLNYRQDEYVYAGMGDIYMATENYTEARNILEKGRSLYPNSKIIRELLVKVYAKIK